MDLALCLDLPFAPWTIGGSILFKYVNMHPYISVNLNPCSTTCMDCVLVEASAMMNGLGGVSPCLRKVEEVRSHVEACAEEDDAYRHHAVGSWLWYSGGVGQ